MSHGPAGDNPYTFGIASFVAGLSYARIPAAVIARIKLLILIRSAVRSTAPNCRGAVF